MDETCTVYQTMDFLAKKMDPSHPPRTLQGKKPNTTILRSKKTLPGITPKILSTRLKELEKHGMITKKIDTTSFPIKCEYTLSTSGYHFIQILKNIKKVGTHLHNKQQNLSTS